LPTVWDQGVGGTPAAQVIRDNLRWSVLWTVRAAPDDSGYAETLRQVEEAFRWWATFGGLGARTRRGLGAFAVTEAAGTQFSYVSADEVARAGLQLVLGKPQPDANTAWQEAIEARAALAGTRQRACVDPARRRGERCTGRFPRFLRAQARRV